MGTRKREKRLLSRLQPRRRACQQAEILSMQVNLPSWLTFRPFNKPFAICSPFQTFLVTDHGPDTSSGCICDKCRRYVGRIWLGDKRSYLEENEDRVGDKEVVLMMKMTSESKRELWKMEVCMGWELVVNDIFVWRECLLSGTCVFLACACLFEVEMVYLLSSYSLSSVTEVSCFMR